MNKIDIKRAVSDDHEVEFVSYSNDNFIYRTDFGEEFAIPLEDTKGAVLNAKDKAIYFMRWMRKHNQLEVE